MKQLELNLADFDYHLPEDRIPNHPAPHRTDARLLVYKHGQITDDVFSQVKHHLPSNAQLVINNTRVIHARLFMEKATGGRLQVFLLNPAESGVDEAMAHRSTSVWWCLVGGAKKWKEGLLSAALDTLHLTAELLEKQDDKFKIRFAWNSNDPLATVVDALGKIPLPPYMQREAEQEDEERYQTTFARKKGSVAAPTAGLHFTPELIDDLQAEIVELTLHVGAGTFKPVSEDSIQQHIMHEEECLVSLETINALMSHKPRFAVGTTSLRTLESLFWMAVKWHNSQQLPHAINQFDPYQERNPFASYAAAMEFLGHKMKSDGLSQLRFQTSIMISPGYEIRSIDGLFTNFHMPKSTLLFLVAAWVGNDWKNIYNHALQNDYRFLSYGDSSLLMR